MSHDATSPHIAPARPGHERLEEWRTRAEQGLPPESNSLDRNRAITARYAGLYLDRPIEFKWAGMAAFASHQVGLALHGTLLGRSPIRDDVEALRRGNNAVYRDIGWAHLAYAAGGATEVRACVESDHSSSHGSSRSGDSLASGFENIEAGAAEPDPERVWAGNESLLAHEQLETVQPFFDRLDDDFAILLTLGTTFDLDGDPIRVDAKTTSSFTWTMLTRPRGMAILFQTRSLPDIRNPTHRWFWVQQSLLPIWQRTESNGRALAQLERLARN